MITLSGKNKNIFYKSIDAIYYILFGIICFLVIYKIYNPEFLYFKLQPFFSTDPCFVDFLYTFKNGLLSLLSQFFLQYLYYPVLGSMLLAFLFLLLAIIIRIAFDNIFSVAGKGFELIPSLVLLISLKNYETNIEFLIMFILLACFLAANRFIKHNSIYLLLIYQLISIYLCFSLLGMIPASILVILFTLDHVLDFTDLKRLIVISGNIIFFFILIFWQIGIHSVKFIYQYDVNATRPQYHNIWIFVIATITSIFLAFIIKAFTKDKYLNRPVLLFLRQYLILILICFYGIIVKDKLFVYDKKYNTEIEYYASKKQWTKVLTYTDKVDSEDRIARFHFNRALYFTGRLSNNLFSVTQDWGQHALLMTEFSNSKCHINLSDLFMEMHFYKAAEYWALEALTKNPYSPRVLVQLTDVSLLLNNTMNAKKYLNILRKSTLYADWANQILNNTDFNKEESDSILNYTTTPFPQLFHILKSEPDRNLAGLLKENPENKMAFEYLLAYYLMRNELGYFHEYLKKYYANMNYPFIPTTYQEVIVLYYVMSEIPLKDFDFKIDPQVLKRFQDFSMTFQKYKDNPDEGRRILYSSAKNTYWYYVKYLSPRTRNVTPEAR